MRRVFWCYLSVSNLSRESLIHPTENGREGVGVSGQTILNRVPSPN